MKKGDIVWGLLLASLLLLFVIPTTRDSILAASGAHPYLGGFIQFAILATMGDLFGKRIASGDYQFSSQVFLRAIVWGIIGCMVTLVFPVYMGGRRSCSSWKTIAVRWHFCRSSLLRQQYHEFDLCSSDEYLPSNHGVMD